KSGRNQRSAFDLKFELDKIVKFIGNDVPTEDLMLDQNILFLPLSANYPGVDFLIWCHSSKILFAFQVTIGSIANHKESKDNFMSGGS
ncbi:22169_t:CDS:1, partial [Racocetra persica]